MPNDRKEDTGVDKVRVYNSVGARAHALTASKQIVLRDLDAVFGASAACEGIGRKHGVIYDGWAASRE